MNTGNPFKLDVVSVRLVKDAPLMSGRPVTRPEDAVEILGEHLCQMDREIVCVLNLNSEGIPVSCHFASMGSLNSCMVHPREILKASILSNAAAIMLMHNHPSGKLQPSGEDTRMTDRMARICRDVEIPLLDHIIVGGDNSRYFSFKEKGVLPMPRPEYATDYQSLDLSPGSVAEQGKAR